MPVLFQYEKGGISYTHSLSSHPDSSNFHAHDFCEFYYFISGRGKYLVESAEYPLQPGTVLLMRSSEVHTPELHPDVPYERIVIQFREQDVSPVPHIREQLLRPFTERPLGVGNRYTSEEYDSAFLQQVLQYIERCGSRENDHLLFTTVLPMILTEFCRSFSLRQNAPETEAATPSQIQSIIGYINAHLYDDLSLDELCRQFFISKTQLGRLFRAATGSTTWDYILIKRLIEARRQILSGIPATQAASNCGFRDYSAFFRAYKKRYDVSPAADRDNAFNTLT